VVSTSVSRASKRLRIQLTVTAVFGSNAEQHVCRTRDISGTGVFLETSTPVALGTAAWLTLLDEDRGEVMSVEGHVARNVPPGPAGGSGGVGIHLDSIPEDWGAFVERVQVRAKEGTGERPVRRLRVLVCSDGTNRRGALALYVQSGWDVRFASDQPGVEEALRGFRIDAVIAEHDLTDERWPKVLEAARLAQPAARRIVRSGLQGRPAPPAGAVDDLVHRVVDLDAGLEAVLDALSADWG
jgi:hypothetical protein